MGCGLVGGSLRCEWSSTALVTVLLEPMDTMDSDRLWLWPGRQSLPLPVWGNCSDPARLCAFDDDTFSDRADRRWPLVVVVDGG